MCVHWIWYFDIHLSRHMSDTINSTRRTSMSNTQYRIILIHFALMVRVRVCVFVYFSHVTTNNAQHFIIYTRTGTQCNEFFFIAAPVMKKSKNVKVSHLDPIFRYKHHLWVLMDSHPLIASAHFLTPNVNCAKYYGKNIIRRV